MTPIVLVDGYNLVYRSFFVFKGLSFEGKPTGVFHGFLSAVLALRRQFGDRIGFIWDYGLPGDVKKPNWRKAIFPEYKASRTHKDAEITTMLQALPALCKVLQSLGWKNIGVPGLEADDILGLITTKEEALIFSTDKDLYQLLDERVNMIVPKKKGHTGYKLLTQAEVETDFGLRPVQWAAYLALGGDSSDGIHVMPGVGPKTAIKMVLAGGNPENPWLENPDSFTEQFPKCRQYWPKLMSAYQVAYIPRHRNDKRIRAYIDAEQFARLFKNYERQTPKTGLQEFRGFCADYGLQILISQSREFL